jgi:hypothetical protein
VCCVVVRHDVHIQMIGHEAVDQVQEPLEVARPMAGGRIGEDLPRSQVQGGPASRLRYCRGPKPVIDV